MKIPKWRAYRPHTATVLTVKQRKTRLQATEQFLSHYEEFFARQVLWSDEKYFVLNQGPNNSIEQISFFPSCQRSLALTPYEQLPSLSNQGHLNSIQVGSSGVPFTAWKDEERNRQRNRQMYLLNFRRLRESCRIPVTNNSFNDSKQHSLEPTHSTQ